ncbi:MAG: NAD+ synthase [Actinomycetota bacterium]|nr:NAD+ synthase [Actinomycetota bacterium]
MGRLRVAACQLDLVVGDLDANTAAILKALDEAEAGGADLAAFPELAITGYPPEDLLLKPGFVADNRTALEKLAARTGNCAAVVGFVDAGRDLYNAAAVCAHGAVQGVYRKRLLPNYSVFDEQRYFAAGSDEATLFVVGGVRVGVTICEDIWAPTGPMTDQAAGGAELIVNISASPYYAGRLVERERMLATRASDASCALVYVNLVGGQDELVFDGASLIVDADGRLLARAPEFTEAVMVADIDVRPVFRKRLLDPRGRAVAPALAAVKVTEEATASGRDNTASSRDDTADPGLVAPLDPVREVYEALVLGTRDYVTKNGFSDVVIGLSGGIDSSLVAVLAVDALGADHVHGVAMPSRFSSSGANDDAKELADRLGIDFRVIAIEAAHGALLDMLEPSFAGTDEGLAEENVQARVRGVVLMALSNKFNWMVLATGNKSEMAAGFATLYGDMAGGFAVIKDVPKTLVFELCRERNRRDSEQGPIPEAVLDKPPSAELRADQRDDQSLPPYDELDPVLEAYVEGDMTAVDLEATGFDGELVRRVVALVDRAEYKRRQAPPGVRVTPKAFGKDRRLPITNHYR